VLNLYGPLTFWLETQLVRAVQACGCRLRPAAGGFPQDGEDFAPHSLVALPVGLTGDTVAVSLRARSALLRMAKQGAPALRSIAVLYMGDELGRFPIDADIVSSVAASLHQSWRPDLEGAGTADVSYLLRPPARVGGGRVYWLPLGCWDAFHPRSALGGAPAVGRRLLWSWVGSVNSKPERGEMLDALQQHPRWDELRARGHVTLLADWNDRFFPAPACTRFVL
jgi:hypothetical protein